MLARKQSIEKLLMYGHFQGVMRQKLTRKLYCGCICRTTSKRYLSDFNEKRGPLDGVRVCDLTSMTAGPYCTMILGDMGAEVIKVEDTDKGDVSRQWGPPFVGNESSYYLSMNRNKKSISVDINKAEGKHIIHELVKTSDVFVESYIPGQLSSLGFGFDELIHINPLLVYCSISGYGSCGPACKTPADSSVVSALSGFMSITGPEDGPACVVGAPITEIITAMHANGAISAALHERTFSKRGKKIETSLLQTQVAYLSHIAGSYLNAGIVGKKYGTAHSSIVPYQAFKTADKMIVIAAGNDDQFCKTCKVLDLYDLMTDDRFKINANRVINRDVLLNLMEEKLVTQTSRHWLDALEKICVPCGPVNSVRDVFSMPQVAALDLIQEIPHPTIGSVKVAGPAIDYNGKSVLSKPLHPPLLGEHTEEIMKDIVSLDEQKYFSLLEKKVIKSIAS